MQTFLVKAELIRRYQEAYRQQATATTEAERSRLAALRAVLLSELQHPSLNSPDSV